MRGVALLFIYVDHVANSGLLELTPRRWQVCDFAEVFLFVSGYAAALRYGPLMREKGWWAGQRKALLRSWTLYRAYLAMFILTLLTVYVCLQWGIRQPAAGLEAFFQAPQSYLLRALCFDYAPSFFSIFPLYCILMLAVPALTVGVARRPWTTLAGSIAVYAVTHWLQMPRELWKMTGQAWDFDPFSWQLVFVFGMLATRFAWPRFVNPRWMRLLAVLTILAMAAFWLLHLHGPRISAPGIGKTHLGPLRLVNFAAWLILAQGWLARVPRPRWLLACGRNSLLIFCAGSWLAIATSLLISAFPGLLSQTLLPLAGVALLAAIARFVPRRRPSQPPRTEPVRLPVGLTEERPSAEW